MGSFDTRRGGTVLVKYAIVLFISLILAFIFYVLLQSYLTKRKYKAKYDLILTHLSGLDLPTMHLCTVFACEDGLIIAAGEHETRIERDRIYRLGFYSEHDLRHAATADKIEIGGLDGLVRTIPRPKADKDIYLIVLNYYDRNGNIAVVGFFNDVMVKALEIFVNSVNIYYGLRQELIEIVPPADGNPSGTPSEEAPPKDSASDAAPSRPAG
jgi:hypothetical protein